MPYAFVEFKETSGGGGSTPLTTANFSTAVSAGDLLIATATCTSGGTFTFSDTLGNTWNVVDIADDSGGSGKKLQMSYCVCASGGTDAVTFSTTSDSDPSGLHAARYSGIAAASTLNAHGFNIQSSPGTATDAVTASATATNQPALVYGFSFYASRNVVPSAGTGFTDRGACWLMGGATNSARAEDKRITATGATSATFTTGTNNAMLTITGIFLESAGSVAPLLIARRAVFVDESIVQF